MPNSIGCIDGTHIRIKFPSIDENLYINRKNYLSINVQGVWDANLKFINTVLKWLCGTYAFILSISAPSRLFETGRIADRWLVGGGDPSCPRLLAPVNNPSTNAEERWSAAYIRTCNSEERTFGVLKSFFRCLDTSGVSLLYSLRKACNITASCVVLYNMCVSHLVPLSYPDPRDTGRIWRTDYTGSINEGARIVVLSPDVLSFWIFSENYH